MTLLIALLTFLRVILKKSVRELSRVPAMYLLSDEELRKLFIQIVNRQSKPTMPTDPLDNG